MVFAGSFSRIYQWNLPLKPKKLLELSLEGAVVSYQAKISELSVSVDNKLIIDNLNLEIPKAKKRL